jgi:predicted CopG family antitoxin
MNMTIYVRDELHRRIKEMKSEANWSEVAQQAFIQEVKNISEQLNKKKTMSQVIDRLKAEKSQATSGPVCFWEEHLNLRYHEGIGWASDRATFEELKAVADYFQKGGVALWLQDRPRPPPTIFNRPRNSKLGVAEFFTSIFEGISMDSDVAKARADKLGEDVLKGSIEDASELNAFLAGVWSVWNEVKDKI